MTTEQMDALDNKGAYAAVVSRETTALAVAVADLAESVAALEHCAATEAAAREALAADVAAIRVVTDSLAVLLREMAPALDAMAAGGGPFAVLGAMRR